MIANIQYRSYDLRFDHRQSFHDLQANDFALHANYPQQVRSCDHDEYKVKSYDLRCFNRLNNPSTFRLLRVFDMLKNLFY